MMVLKLLMKIGNPRKTDDSLKISDKRSRPNKILEVNVKLETPISRRFKDATCGRVETKVKVAVFNVLTACLEEENINWRGSEGECGGGRPV